MTKEAHSLANMSQQKPREPAMGLDYKAARTTGTECKAGEGRIYCHGSALQ